MVGPRSLHRAGQDALDELGLRLGVGVYVVGMAASERPLEVGVAPRVVVVGAKPVSKRDVPGELGVVPRAYIGVVPRPGASRLHDRACAVAGSERLTTWNVEVAAMMVPKRAKALNDGRQEPAVLDDDVHVDHGLRRQTRHRSAADVLDSLRDIPQCVGEDRPQFVELPGPRRVVVDDDDGGTHGRSVAPSRVLAAA